MRGALQILVCCSVVTTACVYNTFDRVDSSAAGSSASGGAVAKGGTSASAAGNSATQGGATSSGGQLAAGQPGLGGTATFAGSPATNGGATAASGGTATVGGRSAATGGTSATLGGSMATGGRAPTGGWPATIGGAATGGETASGGIATTSGGAVATGGSAATGGRATGGVAAATGGSTATAGSTGVGGSDLGIRVYTKLPAVPTGPSDIKNSVSVSIRICNVGSNTISLAAARLAYWYSMDGAIGAQIASVPFSELTGVAVSAIEVDPMRGTTDWQLSVKLPGTATLAAGACILEIQLSVHAGTAWVSGYDLTNDWSYLATTAFALNDHVTMYQGSTLLWGIEPSS